MTTQFDSDAEVGEFPGGEEMWLGWKFARDSDAQQSSTNEKKRGWQAIVGTFADDPLYEEAMRLGREWREPQWDEVTEEAP